MLIKGLLFDFDGTLADTTELILAAFKFTFQHCLKKEVAESEIIKTFGLPLAEAMARYASDEAAIDYMRSVYREYHLNNHDAMIKPIAGVAGALTALESRGLKMAVVTSKRSPMAKRGLKCCALEAFFPVVVGCEDTVNNKPHPEPMLKAAELLGVEPKQCICIGDSPYDLQSGRRAGALTAAVRYSPFNWEDVMTNGKPDFILNNILELLPIIDKLNEGAEAKCVKLQ